MKFESPLLSCFSIFFLIVILFICSGCAEERFPANVDLDRFQQNNQPINQQDRLIDNPLSLPTDVSDNTSEDYILGSGDLVAVTVFETKDLNTEARISSRGTVSLPMLGNIKISGLTAAEAEKKIEDVLRTNYLQNPHVSIYIKEYLSNQITIVGAVSHPGTYDYIRKRRLLDVIAIANGLLKDAGSIAFVTRNDKRTNQRVSYRINLERLIKKGNMEQNISIFGGDVIFIPEAGHCFIDGAVRKPGTYPIKDKITVTQAIALAGGLAGWADTDSIKLIRHEENGERKILSLKYSELHSGVGDSLLLQDQDIVFAESSSLGKFFAGSGFTIGFMGTGFNYSNPQQAQE